MDDEGDRANLAEMEGASDVDFAELAVLSEEELANLSTLELSLNSADDCHSQLGQRVPNLRELRLVDSILPQIRDLGTGLTLLQVLWVPRCGLQEVSGLTSLPQLREFYAAFNDIEDLAPIADLEQLEILDLEANKVEDLDGVAFLGMCPKLRSLNLEENAVTASEDYRSKVLELIPTLSLLDERPVIALEEDAHLVPECASAARPSTADKEMLLVTDGIKYSRVQDETPPRNTFDERASSAPSTSGRPASAAPHLRHSYSAGFPRPWTPGLGSRPSTALATRPGSGLGTRPGTSLGTRPATATGSRPATALGTRPCTALGKRGTPPFVQRREEEASELTFGTDEVFCGNPVQALRRRKASASEGGRDSSVGSASGLSSTVEDLRSDDHDELLQELAAFKASDMETAAAELLEEALNDLTSKDETNDGTQADILSLDDSSMQETTRISVGNASKGRTSISSLKNEEGGSLRTRKIASQAAGSPTIRQEKQVTRSKTLPLGRSASNGPAATKLEVATKSTSLASQSKGKVRSPDAVIVGRLRPRDRVAAQACLVES